MSIRTEPPSSTPNNQDVFVWALYLLGGADQDIDVEAIYLKCFELAPARLAWRTRPDLPDYKKISKALQSIEATTHTGLLLRPHEYSRRLTVDGVRWVETYIGILQATYSGVVQASASNNQYEHRRKLIKSDPVWLMFKNEPTKISSIDLASALNCQPASSENTWRSRINDVLRAADVLKDDELKEFAFLAEKIVLSGQQ